MGLKMLTNLIIARTTPPIAVRVAAGLIAPLLLTVSCEKVPLLAPSGSSITLTSSINALPVNGTTDIIAQVLEQAGTPPHSGTVISFTTTLGWIEPADARTDSSGRATVKFHAGAVNGTATISAYSGGASTSGGTTTGTGTNTTTTTDTRLKIAVGTAAVGRVTVSAN